ncbi:MAG: ribonuclease R [Planctomycetota bacterium]|nr:ribonuclease R [Planctomycetota bacterium]
MPEIFKRQIIKLIKHRDYEPLKLSQLAKALGVSSQDYPQFKLAFDQLQQAGHIIIGTKNLVTVPPMPGRIVGTFRANQKGFGFVIPLDPASHGDLFIPPDACANAMTGDTVAAVVVRQTKLGSQLRYSGKIIEILERAHNRFVGTLLKKQQGWIVQPDGKAFVEPILVDDVTAKNAANNDKVVVEMLSFPTAGHIGRGVIIEVLGRAGQYHAEISSVIHQYHLPGDFDAGCIEQAHKAGTAFDPNRIDSREDLTDKVIITIDPPDAKDFDDAISLEKDRSGNWILGVHIADVSHFIPSDSPLDIEAKERGNSAYLPGRTIPMLPEVLSNGICSLQPQQRRFCKTAYLTYDKNGKLLTRTFANTVICSTQRLTYQQADNCLKGHTKDIKPEVARLLKDMETLARAIEARRVENGMLHLDLPETELIMDKAGRVVDATPADNSYPHTMIEMFMVEANEAVASFLDRHNVPFMRRIHPDPDTLTMKNLSQLVRAFGISIPKTPDRIAIQNLLAAVKDADCSFAVNLVVLRSFEKARYSPLHIGHYALASTHYCHFTSPIRRYADLLIHRLLDNYLSKHPDSPKSDNSLSEQELTEIGAHISFTEQRCDDAENELKKVLILQMLSSHIGDELDCVITGITGFGVFAQCRKYGIEGLIQMNDLGPDQWQYNQKAQCIVGQRTGYTISLGRLMKVRIISVNIPARQLNLCPAEPLAGKTKRQTQEKPAKKFKHHKPRSRTQARRRRPRR